MMPNLLNFQLKMLTLKSNEVNICAEEAAKPFAVEAIVFICSNFEKFKFNSCLDERD